MPHHPLGPGLLPPPPLPLPLILQQAILPPASPVKVIGLPSTKPTSFFAWRTMVL